MFDLKPCPFCGRKARLFVNGGVRVICPKCYAGSRILSDEMEYSSNAVEAVIEAWNRRADVVPAEHARWVDDESGIIICSGCRSGYNLISRFTHYFPNCGAKMDGGEGQA